MNFNDIINKLEKSKNGFSYLLKDGSSGVMLTAVHTVPQLKTKSKLNEVYTSAIVQYVSLKTDSHYIVKSIDDGIDANSIGEDQFKKFLLEKIKKDGISLLIDIHGAGEKHDFDLEFGTLNNMTIDANLVSLIEEEFRGNGFSKITHNSIFKGGGITRYVYENSSINVIQIEINKRNRNDLINLERICNSLIAIIEKSKTI